MSLTTNAIVARRVFEDGLNGRDASVFEELVGADYINHEGQDMLLEASGPKDIWAAGDRTGFRSASGPKPPLDVLLDRVRRRVQIVDAVANSRLTFPLLVIHRLNDGLEPINRCIARRSQMTLQLFQHLLQVILGDF